MGSNPTLCATQNVFCRQTEGVFYISPLTNDIGILVHRQSFTGDPFLRRVTHNGLCGLHEIKDFVQLILHADGFTADNACTLLRQHIVQLLYAHGVRVVHQPDFAKGTLAEIVIVVDTLDVLAGVQARVADHIDCVLKLLSSAVVPVIRLGHQLARNVRCGICDVVHADTVAGVNHVVVQLHELFRQLALVHAGAVLLPQVGRHLCRSVFAQVALACDLELLLELVVVPHGDLQRLLQLLCRLAQLLVLRQHRIHIRYVPFTGIAYVGLGYVKGSDIIGCRFYLI
ncbi:MAG: hypothetical protein IJ168_07535 [Eubacterium sp.]|nr:hypothetical protein [Eubacterium sp.]